MLTPERRRELNRMAKLDAQAKAKGIARSWTGKNTQALAARDKSRAVGQGQWTGDGLGKLKAKSKRKRAHGRYLLDAAKAYGKAMKRREGSTGAASPVRRIEG